MTPLESQFLSAVKQGDVNAVAQLLAQDRALVNAKTDTGESAILLAAYYGQKEIARLLIDSGATLNVWEAAANGATERVRELVTQDRALVHAHSHDGFTPLQLAAFFGHAETVAYLVAQGADVNAIAHNQTFARGVPILQSAVASGNADVVRQLLDAGTNVNVLNDNEGTPLFAAAFDGNGEIARLLLERGADPNLKTKAGETPLAIAKKKGHQAIVDLLSNHMHQ